MTGMGGVGNGSISANNEICIEGLQSHLEKKFSGATLLYFTEISKNQYNAFNGSGNVDKKS